MNKILCWNCRGLGSPRAINALKRIITLETPQMIFLSETKMKAWEMETIKNKVRGVHMVAVSCDGDGRKRRGGVALIWGGNVEIKIQSFSLNHIDAIICQEGREWWRFSGIYGHPETENKSKTGELLKGLHDASRLPWVCGGDFNLMLFSHEKKGGNVFDASEAEIFREAVERCGLIDLGFVGYDYTWSNNQGGEDNIQERLDRCLATMEWKNMFQGAFVSHLGKRKSDHVPILLTAAAGPRPQERKRRQKLFRFEECWMRDEKCVDVIREAWRQGGEVDRCVNNTARELQKWGKKHFGSIDKELSECRKQMSELVQDEPTEEVIAQMKALDARMDELEEREEVYWKQRSRQDWLQGGDKNTKFFHAKAQQRKDRNSIMQIKDEAGNMYDKEPEIEEIFVNFFEDLFTTGAQVDVQNVIDKVEVEVSIEKYHLLAAPFVGEEVKEALFQMHPSKAPGPDGMSAMFYQKFWGIVGRDVIEMVLGVLNNGEDIAKYNHTHLVLIPKKKLCETPKDYRPISLCNVLYKVVAKVLANRLKGVLPHIISENQSGFGGL